MEWGTPDPTLFLALTMNLSKHAKHPEAGKLLIDFIISEEGQELLAAEGLIPALPGRRPANYARLNSARLVGTDYDKLYGARPKTWFDERIREFFQDPK